MSHVIHHTEGLILSRRDYGEANSLYQIFSNEFGLITVAAQGVRYLKSKLRGQLVLFGHGHFALVRGREVWRLTGAEASPRLEALSRDFTKLLITARISNLFARLIRGEERHPELFADLLSGLERLALSEKISRSVFEQIIVLRILARLGYVSSTEALAPWLVPDLWQKSDWSLSEAVSVKIISAINHGLTQSQL